MSYRIKEMVHTLQGEGSNAGCAVILCRFEGCNLSCGFCDTDHDGVDGEGGGVFETALSLAEAAESLWRGNGVRRVLCTGGEPLLQLDGVLVDAFHEHGFRVLVETNGTLMPPGGVDFICVSPKDGVLPVIRRGDELKLPYPLEGSDPSIYRNLDFRHFYLQPIWDGDLESNIRRAVRYCLDHPLWRLSLQMHKYAGIP